MPSTTPRYEVLVGDRLVKQTPHESIAIGYAEKRARKVDDVVSVRRVQNGSGATFAVWHNGRRVK